MADLHQFTLQAISSNKKLYNHRYIDGLLNEGIIDKQCNVLPLQEKEKPFDFAAIKKELSSAQSSLNAPSEGEPENTINEGPPETQKPEREVYVIGRDGIPRLQRVEPDSTGTPSNSQEYSSTFESPYDDVRYVYNAQDSYYHSLPKEIKIIDAHLDLADFLANTPDIMQSVAELMHTRVLSIDVHLRIYEAAIKAYRELTGQSNNLTPKERFNLEDRTRLSLVLHAPIVDPDGEWKVEAGVLQARFVYNQPDMADLATSFRLWISVKDHIFPLVIPMSCNCDLDSIAQDLDAIDSGTDSDLRQDELLNLNLIHAVDEGAEEGVYQGEMRLMTEDELAAQALAREEMLEAVSTAQSWGDLDEYGAERYYQDNVNYHCPDHANL